MREKKRNTKDSSKRIEFFGSPNKYFLRADRFRFEKPPTRAWAGAASGGQHSNGNILSAMRLANMTYYLRSVKFQRLLTR